MPNAFLSVPAEFVSDQNPETESQGAQNQTDEQRKRAADNQKVRQYVISWRNQLRQYRYEKLAVWNECWQLYRGAEDWTDKEDWQSKITLPKAFSSVKQATNVIKRLLNAAKKPYNIEAENPNDQVTVIRSEQMTHITQVLLEKAKFIEEFTTGLEAGFIQGVGIWKLWWGLVPRVVTKVQTKIVPGQPVQGVEQGGLAAAQSVQPVATPTQSPAATNPQFPEAPEAQPIGGGVPIEAPASNRTAQPVGQLPKDLIRQDQRVYPTQLGQEAINPMNLPGPGGAGQGGLQLPQIPMVQQKSIVREEILEGKLFIKAVDPYNFYWLPGSKMNRWTGTIEEIEVPKWELIEMADLGVFDKKLVKEIQPMKIEEGQKQSWLRWGEMPRTTNGPTADTGVVKLTEYYGPIVLEGEMVEKDGHVLVANDTVVLINGKNQFWHRKAPYVGYSPVGIPFRTEGIGLIEMVRQIDKALNRLANMSVDTLMFRLMPIFEMTPDVYENPQDFDTGMVPGKIFRRNAQYPGQPGLKPITMEDISQGTVQVQGILDRAHQEGALVSEIQQSLPRFRGAQTATETETMQTNQQSFFGSMAADIEIQAVGPIVEMALDLILQFIDTTQDPRIASILGIEAGVLAGMSREEVMELIQGDYKVHVRGITGQLEKADMLQNLVQFMNLIGQNPQAWLPYINQSKLLQRILEAFRPAIHDIEQIIADPETVEANKQAMLGEQITPDLLKLIPQLIQVKHDAAAAQFDQAQAVADQTHAHHVTDVQQGLDIARLQHDRETANLNQPGNQPSSSAR
jgi:hypothetical protein